MTDRDHDSMKDHQDWLRSIIGRRVGDQDADDVMQEVAVAVERATVIPDDPTRRRHWLARVALRQCALFVRGASRHRAKLQKIAEHPPADPTPCDLHGDPVHWLLARESESQMQQAIAAMDASSREILMMKLIDNATYQQIGTSLGISKDAAEYRVSVAKNDLRRLVTEFGIREGDL